MTIVLARMAAPPRFAPSGNPLPARLGTAFSAPGACGGRRRCGDSTLRIMQVGLFGCGQVDEPNFGHLFRESRNHLYCLDIPLILHTTWHRRWRCLRLFCTRDSSPHVIASGTRLLPHVPHPVGWVISGVGTGLQVSTVPGRHQSPSPHISLSPSKPRRSLSSPTVALRGIRRR